MLGFMERSTVKLLKQRGNTNTEIAEVLGRDRKTIANVLSTPTDKTYQRSQRTSIVTPYEELIHQWIEEDIPVTVMLEKARKCPQMPYQGGATVFYDRVRLIRRELKIAKQKAIFRFEGLPGEYLQVDWGEKRNFPFTMIPQETRYCFVGRLKYSRFLYAEFHDNMRLAGRTFRDDEDLSMQLSEWLTEKNSQKCQAHGRPPGELLEKERKAFEPLAEKSDSYGLLHLRSVSGESVIRFDTNCYSVPEELIGQVVAVRVAEKELRIYYENQLIAQHTRSFGKKQWIRDLSHYEKTLEKKPRAKVMAYREKLLSLEEPTPSYVAEICRRDRNEMNQQILKLYALWEENGTEKFVDAVRFCSREQVYGASYVELMLRMPQDEESRMELLLSGQPIQDEIDRDLAIYDTYTHR